LATLGGAALVCMQDELGNFECGKFFDTLLVNPQADNSPFDVRPLFFSACVCVYASVSVLYGFARVLSMCSYSFCLCVLRVSCVSYACLRRGVCFVSLSLLPVLLFYLVVPSLSLIRQAC
jgi:hypothetical protein